ncbi:coiled-coil domain-containing protein 42 homolog [Cyprinodon tularosa]|uniref:coiled-coil domain-containing protein 42 homolog n=1 Tax=Cyprinodon tularosa TaxID=77115 RepID=UPI0018E1F6CD|nr:coiled-coil domain-containing protein 42 homolog [Cyprinodon tularosa]
MTTSRLPFLDRDPHSKPQMETKVKKVFVTELDDNRDRKKEEYHIPAATETSKLLEGGVKMLKKTLIARKQAELHDVDVQLALKRQYFKSCMEALAHKRLELETKQQQAKETEMKFEKFVAENEAKRQRAMKECKAMREQNALKKREIEDLTEQMTKLETRRKVLEQKTEKYRIYEDYLLKTLDRLPSIHRHISNEPLVMPVIRRHEMLSITHQELLQRHKDMQLEVEQGQQQLENMKQQHSIKQLMSNRKLYELLSELEGLEEKNKQAEVNLLMRRRVTRKEAVETGRTLMAVKNLAHHCYLPEYGDLESMSVPTMMDMVKEFILDSADTERRVRKLESCSTASLTDKRWRESLKSIGSKVQIKSSSRVSKMSDTFN